MSFNAQLHQRIADELHHNILPFWVNYSVDEQNGGFYGAVTNDLQIHNQVPRSAVLCARMLWTYSSAYRLYGHANYRAVADHAYRYLTQTFWDEAHGGVYWLVNQHGEATDSRKHIYAQAFAIYGLSEYYRATQFQPSLVRAQDLFSLIEAYSHDPINGGNVDCRSRDWEEVQNTALAEGEPNATKSMNTLLHLMEAYTNLLRVWPNPAVKQKQKGLITNFLNHVVDSQTFHLKLFFDNAWQSFHPAVSYGHDIEASWLLVEAAEVLGDEPLIQQTTELAVNMAEATYQQGRDGDGSLFYEDHQPHGLDKHWWVQAEAMVGFYNAYQLSGREHLAEAAQQCWAYLDDNFVDRTHGDWFKVLNQQGQPYADHYKIGPWECPYHHSRACFEMLERLEN